MSGTPHVAAIVDPFSTGAQLRAEFAARGWPSVAVLSTPDNAAAWGGLRHADGYLDVIDGPDADQGVAALRRYPVGAAIPGAETGGPLAGELAERLGLPGNGTPRRASRRG